MKKSLVIQYCIFLLCASLNPLKAQQVFKTTSTSVISYLEYLPDNYDANSDKYPIVFFLHGIGERGPNTTDTTILKQYIQNVAKHGPPKHVKNGTDFPFILISPQLKNNYGDWPTNYILEVINHCKTYLRIDERKIYLTGLSLGGGGTWWAAQDQPALFAAIAPVCGSRNAISLACGISAENLPVWAFHGDKDTVVPLTRSQAMVNAINACVPKPSPLAKLTVYAGVGHNAWDYAYKPDNTLHTPNVYEWLMSYTNTSNKGNKIPVANAGTDKTVSVLNVSLTGSGTDSDGSISSYGWKKIKGPSATLTNNSSATLSLSNLQLGNYLFSLKITDNNGNTDTDYIKVTVTDPTNVAPVANAGADKTIKLPTNSVSITGSATDSDGTIVSYNWSKISGGAAVLSAATTATVNINSLVQGSYVFRLTANDNDGASHYNDVTVKVDAPGIPMVNAGLDKIVKLPTNSTTLSGSATDADGTIVSYCWTKIAGSPCTINNATLSTLKISNLLSGTYSFRLTAKDNDGNTGFDDVTVVVDAPPVVNAGLDRTITLPLTSSLILSGMATDVDGTITNYLWSKYSGPNVTISGTNTQSVTISKMYEGTYVFKLAATDNLGVQGIDYVTVTVNTDLFVPVVNAGLDKIIKLPTNAASMNGSALDADGTIAAYLWTKISGGSCTMNNTTSSTLKIGNLLSGTYTFRLTAKDNNGYSGFDDVTVVVDTPPVVNAGSDKTITLPLGTSLILTGTASDADGTISKYLWSKYSGPNVTVSGTNTPSLAISKMYEGTYVFKFAATDNLGVQGTDYVTVVVNAASVTTSGRMSVSETELVNDHDIETSEKIKDSNLKRGLKSFNGLIGSTVVIFNASGKQIYAGEWTSDKDEEVLDLPGLYFYNIMKKGVRIDTGKIYKKDI